MSAPLDLGRLADVLRGSSLSRGAFLAEFRRSTDADLEQLVGAAGSGNLARVEELAHRIEGAGKVIGAGPMASACSALAASARCDAGPGVRSALDALLERKDALYACLDAARQGVSPGSEPHACAAGESPQVCAGLVFLVVDDHEFQRSMIVRLLLQLGALEVRGFADGESALEAARKIDGPAILVLDLAMPALNGMEVMRIAAQERLALTVIMNSALSEDMLRWPMQTARSYGAAVLGAVSKPLTAAKLAPLLAQHRHDRRLGTPSPLVHP